MNTKDLLKVTTGAEAIQRTHKHWDDWLAVIPGLVALRKQALKAGALKSRGYNEAFGALLEEHGYGEEQLEKNTRAALINIGLDAQWKRKLASQTEGWNAAAMANMTPRAAWELIRPQDERQKAPARERGTTRVTELEADLGDATDRLHNALELDNFEEQIASMLADPERAEKLFKLYEALHAHFQRLPQLNAA